MQVFPCSDPWPRADDCDYTDNCDHTIVCPILLDFSKAFDLMNHSIFLNKLSTRFNFSLTATDFVKNYLTGREQCVEINHHISEALPINIGVSQGSVWALCFSPSSLTTYLAALNLPYIICSQTMYSYISAAILMNLIQWYLTLIKTLVQW